MRFYGRLGKSATIEFLGGLCSPMEDILVLVEMRIIKWISSRSDFDNIRVNGVLHNWQISLMCGISKVKKVVSWGLLSGGVLRFNVDGWLEESWGQRMLGVYFVTVMVLF